MPANRNIAQIAEAPTLVADGLLLAPITTGPWAALRALRAAMSRLRQGGLSPQVSYVFALSRGGRIVPGRGAEAVLFVMAYRLLPD